MAIVERFAPVLTRSQLANYLSMSANTFDNIRARQPEVDVIYKKAKAETLALMGNSLIADALDGDVVSRLFYLKTQGGWRETDREETTNATQQPFTGFLIERAS